MKARQVAEIAKFRAQEKAKQIAERAALKARILAATLGAKIEIAQEKAVAKARMLEEKAQKKAAQLEVKAQQKYRQRLEKLKNKVWPKRSGPFNGAKKLCFPDCSVHPSTWAPSCCYFSMELTHEISYGVSPLPSGETTLSHPSYFGMRGYDPNGFVWSGH